MRKDPGNTFLGLGLLLSLGEADDVFSLRRWRGHRRWCGRLCGLRAMGYRRLHQGRDGLGIGAAMDEALRQENQQAGIRRDGKFVGVSEFIKHRKDPQGGEIRDLVVFRDR